MKITVTHTEPVEVLCVRAEGGIAGAREAFSKLESRFASLRGRRFYGVLDRDGSYRACAARLEDDDATALGLESWILPGGAYARTKLLNWAEHVHEIGTAFAAMAQARAEDMQRPSIEFYRSEAELLLFLPVHDG